jgi:hypothetical protein
MSSLSARPNPGLTRQGPPPPPSDRVLPRPVPE